MANAFTTQEKILFEDVIEGFDPNNITARQVSNFSPNMADYERAGNTFHRPVPMISVTTTGRDMTSNFEDHTELAVPVSLVEASDIHNVGRTYSAVELNDPSRRQRAAVSARQALSAKVDRIVGNKVSLEGAIMVTKATAINAYADFAACEEAMTLIDVPLENERTMIINPTDYNASASDLASRETLAGKALTAYEKSQIGNVASFQAFKANFTPTLRAETVGALTVTGTQRFVPAAMSSNIPRDNRYMDLTVSATTNVVAGDTFTLPNCFRVSLINKEATTDLQTFRVIEVVDGTTLKISPPIISADSTPTQPELEYQNTSAPATNAEALTWINVAAAKTNPFWCRDAVELINGSMDKVEFNGMAGVQSMTETTDSGITVMFSKGADINDMTLKYRWDIFVNAVLLEPQLCGVLIGGQT